ncbi:HAD family hydrolase [Halobaculum sp. MBLA0147]|uniref:HAD family hydrolase n=1 Tax=Halobaculum sp. MBLA0147 TaxID=3079934 RepID=UPI00352520EE
MFDTAIWFDLDGTLLDFDSYGVVLERACETVGLDGEERTTFVQAYDEQFMTLLEELADEPYRQAARAGIDAAEAGADPAAFVDALHEAECAETHVPRATVETLAGLQASDDVGVGVLTNGVTTWQRSKLAHHELDEYVDAVVVSEEAGAHKPRTAPFDLAAERLPAADRWMVGDDRDADVAGARTAGWHATHVATPTDVPDAVAEIRESTADVPE